MTKILRVHPRFHCKRASRYPRSWRCGFAVQRCDTCKCSGFCHVKRLVGDSRICGTAGVTTVYVGQLDINGNYLSMSGLKPPYELRAPLAMRKAARRWT